MKPIGDKVYAQLIEETTTKGGLILGSANLEKHQAKVLFIGPKVKKVKVGDVVRFNHNTAVYHQHEGTKGVFLNESKNIQFIV